MLGMSGTAGTPLEGEAHIMQSVRDIITTPKGTRVMLREYGCDVPDLIDRPTNELFDLELKASIAEALARWEPRFRLTAVWVSSRSTEGRVVIGIEGTIVASGRTVRLEGITL